MLTKNYPEIDFYLQFYPFKPFEPFVEDKEMVFSLEGTQLLYMYGLGQGLWFSQVEPWLKQNLDHILVILEDEMGAVEAFLKTAWAGTILNHPQVYLKCVPLKEMWESVLSSCAQEFPFDHRQITALNSYAKRKKNRLGQIKLQIERKTIFLNTLMKEELLSPLFHRNILSNISKLPTAFYVNKWQGFFEGVPAIICGAGPSLANESDILNRSGQKALIFAGGSAISALGALNVEPHFALAFDPNPQEYEHLKHLKCPETPLIFSSRLYPEARELFTKELGYLSSATGGPLETFLEEKLNLKEPVIGPNLGQEALSVTTLATSLAYALGCNPIIFVGVDMAYTDKKMYAPGVISNQKPCTHYIWRKNSEGKRVTTLVKWIMESETISNYAKNHPDHLFFNASQGLGFKHIPNKCLKEILETYPTLPNLKEKISKKIEETRFILEKKDVSDLFIELGNSLVRSLSIVNNLLKEESRTFKILLETDLTEEIAFKPCLEGVLFAFTLAKRKNYPISDFERAKWSYLKECIEQEIDHFSKRY